MIIALSKEATAAYFSLRSPVIPVPTLSDCTPTCSNHPSGFYNTRNQIIIILMS